MGVGRCMKLTPLLLRRINLDHRCRLDRLRERSERGGGGGENVLEEEGELV